MCEANHHQHSCIEVAVTLRPEAGASRAGSCRHHRAVCASLLLSWACLYGYAVQWRPHGIDTLLTSDAPSIASNIELSHGASTSALQPILNLSPPVPQGRACRSRAHRDATEQTQQHIPILTHRILWTKGCLATPSQSQTGRTRSPCPLAACCGANR